MISSYFNKDKIKISFVLLIAFALIIGLAIYAALWGISYFMKSAKKFPPEYKVQLVKLFPFSEENSLKEWEEKVFKDKVVYKIEKNKDLSYVRATSNAAASALYYRLKLDAKRQHPAVSWKWRVDKFPAKKLRESFETQNGEDFAAHVYVIFPALFFTNSKVLEYVWAETLPVDTIGTSPYSKNIKLIVAQSGPAKNGEWDSQSRDIIADYKKAFGRTPELDIGAVAFMTNAEHTGTSADAVYDDIKLGYKEENGKGGTMP